MAMPYWVNSLVKQGSDNDSAVLFVLLGSVLLVFIMCCVLNCLKYRIPRTKQEIQLRLHKTTLTKDFRRYLNMLTVTTETTFDDALARVQVLREADLNGFERRVSVRRNTQSDLSKGLKDQCLTISMPEICQTAPNNITLLPLDISVVKEILQHQHQELAAANSSRERPQPKPVPNEEEETEQL